MTTRNKIAERILRILQGGDVTGDSDIDIREIKLHVDSERDSLIQQKFVQSHVVTSRGKKQVSPKGVVAHEILGAYISESTFSTSVDSIRNQSYISLKETYLDLPDEGGVVYVRDVDDLSVSFKKLSAGTESIYASLPSFSASKASYYTVIGNRIYFSDDNPPANVLAGLIISSSSISDTSAFPLSPGDEAIIIKSVLDLYNLMNTVKQDFINDNIDQ